MFKGRSVIEIMVLLFTIVVGFTLVTTGIMVMVVEFRDPKTDTTTIVQSLISLISGILGALLGLIAGKTVQTSELSKRPGDDAPTDLNDPIPK